jgi:Ca-activated chloride channel family protein
MDEQEHKNYPGEEHYYRELNSPQSHNDSETMSYSSFNRTELPLGVREKQKRRPSRLVLFFSIFALFVVIAGSAFAFFALHFSQHSPQNSVENPGPVLICKKHSSNPVTLTMYYDTEEQDWMNDVVQDFNHRKMTACDGPITVNATGLNPGDTQQKILNGQIQPDIWSPGGASWLDLLSQQWQKKYGENIINTDAQESPSLIKSPVVIAMWKPMAVALGWPDKAIGWSDIYALSTNPQGWAAYGHPEWGNFKFGHTNPNYSDSGRDAIIAENYAAVHKTTGLTLNDVNKQTNRDFVAGVENSVIHYGDDTNAFADEMFAKGPSYLSAVVMNESSVVEANTGEKYQLAYPVVAIYPKEGTFVSDHPLAVLQASWVTPAKKNAELVFRKFLLDTAQQKKALQYGFRPGTSSVSIDAPINEAHGADPQQPYITLLSPPHDVSIVRVSPYHQVDVMLLLDHSGSMDDEVGKFASAKAGIKEFVGKFGDSDKLGLTIFNDQSNVVVQMNQLGPERQQVLNSIDNIETGGNTSLYDAIATQQESLQDTHSKDIKALIVLTDGLDTSSSTMNLRSLIQQISLTGDNAGEGVHIYTIAYGRDADSKTLNQIAHFAGGKEYDSSPDTISEVYDSINHITP